MNLEQYEQTGEAGKYVGVVCEEMEEVLFCYPVKKEDK